MAQYNITQKDIYLLKSPKRIHINVYLLDDDLIVDELAGYVVSGDGSEDANSDNRRSCSFVIHSYDSTYDIGEYNRIWLNKRVKIDLGYEYLGEVIYYTKGIFVFNSCSYAYDGSTRDISFQCSDLISTIDGTHGGTLIGESFLIEGTVYDEENDIWTGNDIKKCVEDLLEQNGIKKHRIGTIGQVSCLQGYANNWIDNRVDTGSSRHKVEQDADLGFDNLENDNGTWHMIPYDMEFDKGVTLWEVLTKIRDLYPGYEMFFDKDGTFVFQLIPICHHDRDVLDHTQFEGLVISENTDIDFTTVRNATKVYGESIETDRYTETSSLVDATFDGNTVLATKPEFDMTFAYSGNIVLGMLFPEYTDEQADKDAYLTINDEVYPIVMRQAIVDTDENGTARNVIKYENLKYSYFNTTDMYCFKWLSTQKLWVYAGMYQIEGYCENNDPNSPFAIDKIGYRLQVLSGGVYDDITTSTLAQERAEYENWLVSRLNDSISLETVIIPFLEVNQKIQYRKLSTGSIDSYIIKSLNYSFTDATMTMTMNKFYELDPFIVCS